MFDKIQFDRNAFDRSVSSRGIGIGIVASGALQLNMGFPTPISISFSGSSSLVPGLYASALFGTEFSGSGGINELTVVFYQVPITNIKASGDVTVNMNLRMPLSANLSGYASLEIDNRVLALQNLNASFVGVSDVGIEINSLAFLNNVNLSSGSLMTVKNLNFQIPITIAMSGASVFTLRRLSALNEKSFTLEDINLLPGETVIIDTDLLTVLFNSIEDVSSVTTDSIFFELSPGDNEIAINTDSAEHMDVTAIWQNRWL